ncbi:transposase [Prosthecobacter sp.]|uniref:transposase n=1 Tax=Prosthecobacter sp. TaxID=1965333 RepID=UPI003783CE1D
MERWLDAGYGECVLRDERCQKEVAERLLFRHGQDYDLGDWVVMPNHVHVLLQPLGNVSLEEIMRPIKGVSARNINRMLERSGAMWMQESFSHIVRSLEQLKKFQRYIQMNPEKAGLPATDFSYEQRWEIVRSTLGIASLRSPFGQPAAGYLRCALVPARRSAFSTAPAFPNNQTVGSRRACELCRSSMPLL